MSVPHVVHVQAVPVQAHAVTAGPPAAVAPATTSSDSAVEWAWTPVVLSQDQQAVQWVPVQGVAPQSQQHPQQVYFAYQLPPHPQVPPQMQPQMPPQQPSIPGISYIVPTSQPQQPQPQQPPPPLQPVPPMPNLTPQQAGPRPKPQASSASRDSGA